MLSKSGVQRTGRCTLAGFPSVSRVRLLALGSTKCLYVSITGEADTERISVAFLPAIARMRAPTRLRLVEPGPFSLGRNHACVVSQRGPTQ